MLRVACGGCGGARGQAVSLLPGGREGNIPKVMKVCVCVCVCVLVGIVREAKNGIKCTYALWYPEIGAVSGVGSSGGMCSGMLDSGFVWHI